MEIGAIKHSWFWIKNIRKFIEKLFQVLAAKLSVLFARWEKDDTDSSDIQQDFMVTEFTLCPLNAEMDSCSSGAFRALLLPRNYQNWVGRSDFRGYTLHDSPLFLLRGEPYGIVKLDSIIQRWR